MKNFSCLECFEVLGCILDDVGRLVSEYLSAKIFENEGKVLGNGILLNISACHSQLYYSIVQFIIKSTMNEDRCIIRGI